MRKVHACFQRSHDLDDEHLAAAAAAAASAAQSRAKRGTASAAAAAAASSADPEFFLASDSPLRSDNGELIRPMLRPPAQLPTPFASPEMLLQTLDFRYWLQTFFADAENEGLPKAAKAIVQDVCTEQTKKDLRDRGSVLQKALSGGGDREMITPLTLVLHELKLWCAVNLRQALPSEQKTYLDIVHRIKYLTLLHSKDVWWKPGLVVKHGLSGDKLSKLFHLLERTIATLTLETEFAFTRYANRRVHDRMGWLLHVSRSAFFNSARLLACLCSLDGQTYAAIVQNGKQIQPSELLEPTIAPRSTTDWTNLAHLSLRALCSRRIVRAALTADFSAYTTATPEELTDFAPAPSLFPKPAAPSSGASAAAAVGTPQEPPALMQDRYGHAVFHQAAYDSLIKELRSGTRANVKYPLTKERQLTRWTRAFLNADDTRRAMLGVWRVVAALEDVIPAIVAAHQVWMLSVDSSDVSACQVLKPQIVRSVGELGVRLAEVEGAELCLVREWTDLAAKYLAQLGRLDEASQMLAYGPGVRRNSTPGKPLPKRPVISYYAIVGGDPVWMQNLDHAVTEIVPTNHSTFQNAYREAREVARDAMDFPFMPDIFAHETRERACARVVDIVCERIKTTDYRAGFQFQRMQPKLDWLGLGKDAAGAFADMSVSPPESEAAALVAKREELAGELQALIKGGGNVAELEQQMDDVLGGLEQISLSTTSSSTTTGGGAKDAASRPKSSGGGGLLASMGMTSSRHMSTSASGGAANASASASGNGSAPNRGRRTSSLGSMSDAGDAVELNAGRNAQNGAAVPARKSIFSKLGF